MRVIADLANRLEILLYIGLAAGAVLYLRAFLRAHRQLSGTVFGLERETLYAHRSGAFSMLFVCIFLATALYVSIHLVVPALNLTGAGEPGRATPSVLMTPVEPAGPVLAPVVPTLSPENLPAAHAVMTDRPSVSWTQSHEGTLLDSISPVTIKKVSEKLQVTSTGEFSSGLLIG